MEDKRVTNRFKTVAQYFSAWAPLTFRARSFFVLEASYLL